MNYSFKKTGLLASSLLLTVFFAACFEDGASANESADTEESANTKISDNKDESSSPKEKETSSKKEKKKASSKDNVCQGGKGWVTWYDESSDDNLFNPRSIEIDGEDYVDFFYKTEGVYYKLDSDTKFCVEYDVVEDFGQKKEVFAFGHAGDDDIGVQFMKPVDENASYEEIAFDKDDLDCWASVEVFCSKETKDKGSKKVNIFSTPAKVKTKKIMAYNVEKYKASISKKSCKGGEGWVTWYDVLEEENLFNYNAKKSKSEDFLVFDYSKKGEFFDLGIEGKFCIESEGTSESSRFRFGYDDGKGSFVMFTQVLATDEPAYEDFVFDLNLLEKSSANIKDYDIHKYGKMINQFVLPKNTSVTKIMVYRNHEENKSPEDEKKTETSNVNICRGGDGWELLYDYKGSNNVLEPSVNEKYGNLVFFDYKNDGPGFGLDSDSKICIEYDVEGVAENVKTSMGIGYNVSSHKFEGFTEALDETKTFHEFSFNLKDSECFSNEGACSSKFYELTKNAVDFLDVTNNVKVRKIMVYGAKKRGRIYFVEHKICEGGDGWKLFYDYEGQNNKMGPSLNEDYDNVIFFNFNKGRQIYKLNSGSRICLEYEVKKGAENVETFFGIGYTVNDNKFASYNEPLDENQMFHEFSFNPKNSQCFSNDGACSSDNLELIKNPFKFFDVSNNITIRKIMVYGSVEEGRSFIGVSSSSEALSSSSSYEVGTVLFGDPEKSYTYSQDEWTYSNPLETVVAERISGNLDNLKLEKGVLKGSQDSLVKKDDQYVTFDLEHESIAADFSDAGDLCIDASASVPFHLIIVGKYDDERLISHEIRSEKRGITCYGLLMFENLSKAGTSPLYILMDVSAIYIQLDNTGEYQTIDIYKIFTRGGVERSEP